MEFAPRPLIWLVDTLRVLKQFPPDVRTKLGFGLFRAQVGEKQETAKRLVGVGATVWQLKAARVGGTYRAVYVVHLNNAVYVLHVFQKKAKSGIETPQREIQLIRQRLKLAMQIDGEVSSSG